MPVVGLIFKAVIHPFPITLEGGKIIAVAVVDGVERIGGGLNVVVPTAYRRRGPIPVAVIGQEINPAILGKWCHREARAPPGAFGALYERPDPWPLLHGPGLATTHHVQGAS